MYVCPLPSQKVLMDLLEYDPETGVFLWSSPPGTGKIKPGATAGYMNDGYRLIGLTWDGRRRLVRAHRIAWKIMTGEEPPLRLDHVNRDRSDNRWVNLRDGTGTVNHDNREWPRFGSPRNKGLPTGISRHGRGYMAKRCNAYLGTFDTAEQARQAYLEARSTPGPSA